MLDADRVVRLLGRLGKVRRALVGDELATLQASGGVGDHVLDEVGGLALVDGERVEQAALAITEVLHANELEVDAEHAQIGSVAAELGVGRGHAEIEAPGVAVVERRGRRWCRRWCRRWRCHRPVLPRAQRALGQRDRRAEVARGDAVLGGQPIESTDELVLHSTAAHGHGAEREQSRRDREQRAEQGRAIVARRGGPASAPGRRLDELREHALHTPLDPAEPIGTGAALGDQLRDRPREPRRLVLGDDARANQRDHERKTGLGRRILRSRKWHGASVVAKRRNSDATEPPRAVQENGYDSTRPSTMRRPPRCNSA